MATLNRDVRDRTHRRRLPTPTPSCQDPISTKSGAMASSSFSRATRALVASAWLIVLLGSATLAASDDAGFPPPLAAPAGPPRPAPRAAGAARLPPRKVLRPADKGAAAARRPARMDEGCAGAEDISIFQDRALILPNGVPAYKVDVMNQCVGDDCAIAGIHVRCGWFSSVMLVDPSKFRRLRHNDCLLNDGQPLQAGEIVSFTYANSFPYSLSVTAATCVNPKTLLP